jgi:hypothetical protein
MHNQWTIELSFDEDADRTAATATLSPEGGAPLRGHGYARRNPSDRPAARIGEEVAAARALSNLAHELLERAAGDIEAATERPARITG